MVSWLQVLSELQDVDTDFFEAFVDATEDGRASEANDVAEGGRDEGAVVVPDDVAGKFVAEGGEVVKNKAIDGSGDAAEGAEGAG